MSGVDGFLLQLVADVLVEDEAATGGRWRVSMHGYSVKSDDDECPIVCVVPGGVASSPDSLHRWLANAELIAFYRSAAPVLARALKGRIAENDARLKMTLANNDHLVTTVERLEGSLAEAHDEIEKLKAELADALLDRQDALDQLADVLVPPE